MTRRDMLAFAAAASLPAQQTYPGGIYRDYSKVLPQFLRRLAGESLEIREAALRQLTDAESIRERQRWARTTFWKLIGDEPSARTPLRPRPMGVVRRRGYRIEKVVYESQPGFFVTANLYVPEGGKGSLPAVLLQMGHSPAGKAYGSYQRCAQGLVQLGFVVLAFDPMGQGERAHYLEPGGSKSRLPSADDEHSVAGWQQLLTGDSATRMQTWDAIRSLDYLESLPFVDKKRIGTTGQSGGGTTSMFLTAADDRIAAAAICSGNTENYVCPGFDPPGSTDDAEQNFPGSAPLGFDRWDLLYPLAPKPLLVSVSDKDFLGTYSQHYIENGWHEFQRLQALYSILGKPENIAWNGTPLPHALEYDTRLLVYNWFRKFFLGREDPITEEPSGKPEAEETLYCTATGSAVRSLDSATPHSLNVARYVSMRRTTEAPLAALLKVPEGPAPSAFRPIRSTVGAGIHVESLEVESEKDVHVPLWLFLPRPQRSARAVIVVLDPGGRNREWHEDEMYPTLARRGFSVCVPDVRGVGDLTPEFQRGNPRYARNHNEEEDYAWASLVLGRPLLGQRTMDVVAVCRALRVHSATQGGRTVLAARGRFTPLGQCAAAIVKGVDTLFLSGGVSTFETVLRTQDYVHSVSNFVPGLTLNTDLPFITATAGAGKVVLAGMVDGAGRTLDRTMVKNIYRSTSGLEVLAQPSWSAEGLARTAG